MSAQQEIIDAIDIMIKKRIENLTYGSDISAVVIEIRDKEYKVIINGNEQWVHDGVGCSPAVGDAVWLRIPNGKIVDAYIEAKK